MNPYTDNFFNDLTNLDSENIIAIDWGDGSLLEYSNFTHKYVKAGLYKIKIYGILKFLYFYDFGYDSNLCKTGIDSYGDSIVSITMINFNGIGELTSIPYDPDADPSPVTHYLFFNTIISVDITNLDISNVTNMSNMFNGCTSFNQKIGNWDVSNVTSFYNMFYGCDNFNQSLCDWITDVKDIKLLLDDVYLSNQYTICVGKPRIPPTGKTKNWDFNLQNIQIPNYTLSMNENGEFNIIEYLYNTTINVVLDNISWSQSTMNFLFQNHQFSITFNPTDKDSISSGNYVDDTDVYNFDPVPIYPYFI